MTVAISTERVFSLSCFEGLRLFRAHISENPSTDILEVLELVQKVEPDAESLDMEAAFHLHSSLALDCPLDGERYYQICIKAVVIGHQPIWAKTMRQGRVRFIDSLSKDDRDVFAAAGLLASPPDISVVGWWDDIVCHARLAVDIEKMEQARRAEALSIEHEIARLAKIGVERAPKWTGLDDNFAGYDVLSYDLVEGSLVNKMIEVKSTTNSPLRFFISRNEWNTAAKIGDAYVFHVWNMAVDPPVLYIKSVEDILPHIPSDNDKGKWSNAAIPAG